jgi:steroid delta-isomerase-like uncharacterized protein
MSFRQWRSFVLTILFVGVLITATACNHSMAGLLSQNNQPAINTRTQSLTTLEQNKAIITRLIGEALNKGNFNIVDELIATDALDNDAFPNQPPGREGFRYHFRTLKTAMPDLKVTFKLFADGNTVIEEWMGRGTQTGPLLKIPPSGRKVEFPGLTIFELADGKVTSRRTYQDSIVLQRQLGLVPPETN